MATAAKHHKTPFEKWKETIDAALTSSTWDEYDCEIMRVANEFNHYLAKTPGFKPLDWRVVKAMIWTETGGPSDSSWTSRPMQIGNPGDPGLRALLSGRDGGELIIPPALKQTLTATSAIATPVMNIRAGTAYLLMRFASYGYRTVTQGPVSDYIVQPGDSFDKIAREDHSTVQTLQRLNPGVHTLHAKQVIEMQKASLEKIITGWHPITTTTIAHKYNVGDTHYSRKLEYCLSVMSKTKRDAKCK